MKRSVILLLLMGLVTALLCGPAMAAPPLTVQINGSVVDTPVDMDIAEGQVMVPLRWAAEQIGDNSVQWDSATRTVTIKTKQDIYNIEKLASYIRGLKANPDGEESQILPLPDRVKNLEISSKPDREWVLELKKFELERQTQFDPVSFNHINIRITDDNDSYEHSSVVYSIENHQDHYYLPMDWLEYLFNATVNYDQTNNTLSIQTPDQNKIKNEIALIENALIPANPDEAVKLWGRGEQLRNGALQYAALSPQLRQEADKSHNIRQTYWVTGFSSPWAGPITITKQKKLSETKMEYTFFFPEFTSNPPDPTATERMVVEKLRLDGKEGWYITQIIQSSNYGIIDGLYKDNSLYLSEDSIALPLPVGWTTARINSEIVIKDEQDHVIGTAEELGGYFLPNHRDILTDKILTGGLGECHLLVMFYQSPAAAEIQESWQEVHAMIPLKSEHWLDISIKASSPDDEAELQKILENVIIGVS